MAWAVPTALRNSIMAGVMLPGEEVTAHRLSTAALWFSVEAKSFSGLSPSLVKWTWNSLPSSESILLMS